MADGVFNIAKGAVAEKARDDAARFTVLLLKVNETEADLIDHNDVAAMLAASNTEADFTNYERKVNLTATLTVDDTNNRAEVDLSDLTWTAAGNGSNNTLTKLIVCYEEPGSPTEDAALTPLTHHDFTPTTDGSDITAQFNASGFFRAS